MEWVIFFNALFETLIVTTECTQQGSGEGKREWGRAEQMRKRTTQVDFPSSLRCTNVKSICSHELNPLVLEA